MQESSCYTLMEKNTLSNYGLILVAVLIVSALLVVFSPLSPFGFSDTIRTAFNDAIDTYINRTNIEDVVPDDDDSSISGDVTNVFCTITIKHVFSTGQEYKPEKVQVSYGTEFDFQTKCLPAEQINGYQVSYCPPNQIITKNQTFEIKYTAIDYTITYNTNGGTILSTPVTVFNIGDAVVYPKLLTRTGYTFVGWYTNPELTGSPVYELPAGCHNNVVLYAKWTSVPLSITYYIDGAKDTSLSPTTMIYNDTNQLNLPTPQKEGYTFDGWYTTGNYTGSKNSKTPSKPTKDIIYYGRWINNTKYTITYVLNGGSFTSTQNIKYEYTKGSSVTLPDSGIITRKGYTFDGWYLDSACLHPANDITKEDAFDVTVYAKWIPIQYSIYYDTDGSLSGPISQYTLDVLPLTLPIPEKDGYEFKGWKPATHTDELWTQIPDGTTENLSLTAVWEAKTFTLTFNPRGLNEGYENGKIGNNTSAQLQITYNSKYNFNGIVPSCEYYDFAYWVDKNNQRVSQGDLFNKTEDTTLYAVYTKKEYPIEYIFINPSDNKEYVYNTDDCFAYTEEGNLTVNDDKYTAPLLEHVIGFPKTMTFDETLPDDLFIINENFQSKFEVFNNGNGAWYYDKNNPDNTVVSSGTKISDLLESNATKDKIQLYCVAKPQSFGYMIDSNAGSFEGASSGYYTYGEPFELPVPTKLGSTFAGWTVKSPDNNNIPLFFVEYTENSPMYLPLNTHGSIILEATWTPSSNLVAVKVYPLYNGHYLEKDGEAVYVTIEDILLETSYSDTEHFLTNSFFGNESLLDFADEYYIIDECKNITFSDADANGEEVGFKENPDGKYTVNISSDSFGSYYTEINVEKYIRFNMNFTDETGAIIDTNKFEKQNENLDVIEKTTINFKKTDVISFALPSSSTAFMYKPKAGEDPINTIYTLTENTSVHTYKIGNGNQWKTPTSIMSQGIGQMMLYEIEDNSIDNSDIIDIFIKYKTNEIETSSKHNITYANSTVIYNGTNIELKNSLAENECAILPFDESETIEYSPALPDYFVKGFNVDLPFATRHCKYTYKCWAYKVGNNFNLVASTEELPDADVTLYSVWVNCPEAERVHKYGTSQQVGCATVSECSLCKHKNIEYNHTWSAPEEVTYSFDGETIISTIRTCINCTAVEETTVIESAQQEHSCIHLFTVLESEKIKTVDGINHTVQTYNCSGCQGCGSDTCQGDSTPCGATYTITQPVP